MILVAVGMTVFQLDQWSSLAVSLNYHNVPNKRMVRKQDQIVSWTGQASPSDANCVEPAPIGRRLAANVTLGPEVNRSP